MEGRYLLFGYEKSKGTGSGDITVFLAKNEIPFRQSPLVLEFEGNRFTFQRRIEIPSSNLTKLKHLNGVNRENIDGKRDQRYCIGEYSANSSRVIRNLADLTFLVNNGGKLVRKNYHELVMCAKPKTIYEVNFFVPIDGKFGKASAQYHSLHSDFLREIALKKLILN